MASKRGVYEADRSKVVQIQYGYEGGPITKFPVCGCGCGCGWLIIARAFWHVLGP